MRKITKQEFIRRAKKIHRKLYDYSLAKYKNLESKVIIICPIHGKFEQTPSSHLSGSGCPLCGRKKVSESRVSKGDIHGKRETLNTEEFILKANGLYGNLYDYSLVNYVNAKTKIKIICLIHGEYTMTPNNHLRMQGCPTCGKIRRAENNRSNKEQFISKTKETHGNLYDYSLVNYVNAKTKIKIICSIHGIFEQTPGSHLRGRGCPVCGINKFTNSRRSNTEEFIIRAKEIHGDIYDYSLVEYYNNTTAIKIICPEHGEFSMTPKSHLIKRSGCPFCSSSAGEREIQKYLKENNILFEFQKTFEDCKHKHVLHFDFYLPKENICIEYDGIQHFEPVEYFGGDKGLKNRKKRDKIKDFFAKENNIKLIRIPYNKNIEEILNESL